MGRSSDVVDHLVDATNAHDIDALVECFSDEYVNETPAHPQRGFSGRDQVRRNWMQIFAHVPDITARIVRRVSDGNTVWSEWEMSGTRRDGSAHEVRGIILFGVEAGRIRSARFYLEPLDQGGGSVDDAVRAQVVRR